MLMWCSQHTDFLLPHLSPHKHSVTLLCPVPLSSEDVVRLRRRTYSRHAYSIGTIQLHYRRRFKFLGSKKVPSVGTELVRDEMGRRQNGKQTFHKHKVLGLKEARCRCCVVSRPKSIKSDRGSYIDQNRIRSQTLEGTTGPLQCPTRRMPKVISPLRNS